MNALSQFQSHLSPELKQIVKSIKTPFEVQEYLLNMPYNAEARDRSPLNVMLDCQCHCLDGGFLAALLLWKLGFTPLILDLRPDPGMDDDHVLSLFQIEGRWGAVAKSNYVNLGFREAVYESPRVLAMTYFEHYLNTTREKTLRSFTRPMDLTKYPDTRWPYDEAAANRLYKQFYKRKEIPLITTSMVKRLSPVTKRNFKAETLGTDMSQVFGIRED
ncbi:MAG: hypothetical protein AB1649_18100 [Chloroflexota bacterium]